MLGLLIVASAALLIGAVSATFVVVGVALYMARAILRAMIAGL